jgi:serine/threonine protein phosphatase 1
MKYYAIADLHGRYDLLLEAINVIYSHAGANDYKIITLGDYIDRGPDSMKVIDHLMGRTGDTICLQGNHEAMMVDSVIYNYDPDWWVGNGGDATLKSYGWGGAPYSTYSYEVVPKSHLNWMRTLPIYHETEKQVFVHAGMPKSLYQGQQGMQWMLYNYNDSGGWKGKHVVHGHHQFADGPHEWLDEETGGRTDLDTWAYHTGRIVIGVFDDTQLHAKEFLEVTA